MPKRRHSGLGGEAEPTTPTGAGAAGRQRRRTDTGATPTRTRTTSSSELLALSAASLADGDGDGDACTDSSRPPTPSLRRRKRRLSASSMRRDSLVDYVKDLLLDVFSGLEVGTPSAVARSRYGAVFADLARQIEEHRACPRRSRLSRAVPSLGTFFTPLPVGAAFEEFDEAVNLSARRFIPPSAGDIRRIMNLSQVLAIRDTLQMLTLDGDETLYRDGADLARDSPLIAPLITLLKQGVRVAVVTAAGYQNAPEKYEKRLDGLLHALREAKLDAACLDRFCVMGGECNFLFSCGPGARLKTEAFESFATEEMRGWSEEAIGQLLDDAQASLEAAIARLGLPFRVLRKARAVGTVRTTPGPRISRAQLDELALSVRHDVAQRGRNTIPFCSFNGGSDVWIDVGDKRVGCEALQRRYAVRPETSLHFGDQFSPVGNDISVRQASSTCWTRDPQDTLAFLASLVG